MIEERDLVLSNGIHCIADIHSELYARLKKRIAGSDTMGVPKTIRKIRHLLCRCDNFFVFDKKAGIYVL